MNMEFGEKRLEAKQDRIRSSIESGEAVDEKDAEEMLREEEDAAFLGSIRLPEHRREVNEAMQSPETDPADRWDLKFRKAVIDTAETPDELEFLWYQMLLDLPPGKPPDEATHRRYENTRHRLERKTASLVEKIGGKRAQDLFDKYRALLQALFNES